MKKSSLILRILASTVSTSASVILQRQLQRAQPQPALATITAAPDLGLRDTQIAPRQDAEEIVYCAEGLSSMLSRLPTPTSPLLEWATTSAPILKLASAIANSNLPDNMYDMCSSAADSVNPPDELAPPYSKYLDQVQSWRYDIEGDAYSYGSRCRGTAGAVFELLAATEAAMCTSGLRQFVTPYNAAPRPTGYVAAAACLAGVAGVMAAM
ncbi:hypothetical protein B0H63DRAFT_468352 [Podospora didyma]|uniref:Infection structure specific protein n=1 Tax=Podospora didyma TaxID=330526 RepID=A0AAE0U0V1_9PEZI|nr:hypothetical protein B0H63DRAFT_468352 [Podospora didyma]